MALGGHHSYELGALVRLGNAQGFKEEQSSNKMWLYLFLKPEVAFKAHHCSPI